MTHFALRTPRQPLDTQTVGVSFKMEITVSGRPNADVEHTMTVAEVAKLVGVGPLTPLAWIRSGALKASNVARTDRAKRPKWYIAPADFDAFLQARSTQPPAVRRRRPRKAAAGKYY